MRQDRSSDSFLNALLKWFASSYGVACLPLVAKRIVTPSASFLQDLCLFVLVLGASGALEAAFCNEGESSLTRTLLIVGGTFSLFYGAIGYATLSAGTSWAASGLLLYVIGVLSVAYLAYKVPLIWDRCS